MPTHPAPAAKLTSSHVTGCHRQQTLLAAAAIGRGDPAAVGIHGGTLRTARDGGFLNTVVTTAPQGTSYLLEHPARTQTDPFTKHIVS